MLLTLCLKSSDWPSHKILILRKSETLCGIVPNTRPTNSSGLWQGAKIKFEKERDFSLSLCHYYSHPQVMDSEERRKEQRSQGQVENLIMLTGKTSASIPVLV
jgi:hypothetical protein